MFYNLNIDNRNSTSSLLRLHLRDRESSQKVAGFLNQTEAQPQAKWYPFGGYGSREQILLNYAQIMISIVAEDIVK